MADTVRLVEYFYITAPNKPGEGARALNTLKEAGVKLLAFSGFPQGRRAQLDFIPADPAAFKRAAKQAKWKVVGPKEASSYQAMIESAPSPSCSSAWGQRRSMCQRSTHSASPTGVTGDLLGGTERREESRGPVGRLIASGGSIGAVALCHDGGRGARRKRSCSR